MPKQTNFHSKRALFRNTIFNVCGQIIPLAIGIYTVPRLIHFLGVERFGLLTLVWVFLGYFSFFDFGLSRSITLFATESQSRNEEDKIPGIFWGCVKIILFFSGIGSLLLFLVSALPWTSLMHSSPELIAEMKSSIFYIALAIPVVTLTTAFRGLIEAQNTFLGLNVLQAILGVYTFASPLLLSQSQVHLPTIVLILLLGRICFFLAHVVLAFQAFPWLKKWNSGSTTHIRELLAFGGWLTVSNVVSPIMVYFDRFFLSALVPAAQIAYYTTPYEILSRLLIFPSSLTRALFPSLTFQRGLKSFDDKLYRTSFRWSSLLFFVGALILFFTCHWGLALWIDQDFADRSTPIFRTLLVGIFFNAMAWLPFTLIQSQGRSDITAKIHLLELPFYIGMLIYLIKLDGPLGAAQAWALRTTVDFIIIYVISNRILRARIKGESGSKPKHFLAIYTHMAQDWDLLKPIVKEALRRSLDFHVFVSRGVKINSPRVQAALRELNVPHSFEYLPWKLREPAEKFGFYWPPVGKFRALLTAVESNSKAHYQGTRVTRNALHFGLKTYTLQHGLENIGLNYSDREYPAGSVTFASENIFVWGPPEGIAPWVPEDLRSRCIFVGSPKQYIPENRPDPFGPKKKLRIGIFENLHWSRYTNDYRLNFFRGLLRLSEAYKGEVEIYIKPHHAGQWLTRKNKLFNLPEEHLTVMDPADPRWEPFTASDLIPYLDLVITTPSTVALDAAFYEKPVAVFADQMEIPVYEPLPLLRSPADWEYFVGSVKEGDRFVERVSEFKKRCVISTDVAGKILDRIEKDNS